MSFNLSAWALQNRQIVLYLMILLGAVGALSYSKLGQSEDPPFTFKAMVVQTNWPGEAGQAFVWVVEPGSSTLRRQAVRTGPYAEDRVPVLEGLKAGDWVVATGVQVLREGQQVRPIDRANRTVKLAAKE